ncbi:helix-turn-helix domain-containing protein [bacterium]|nr:helix-turn-helix domain-containing protein [bacterium]
MPARKPSPADKPKKLYRNPVFVAEEWQKRMKKLGLTRAELARELGVSKARVSQMLNILKLPEIVLVKAKCHGDPMEKRLVTERMLRKRR